MTSEINKFTPTPVERPRPRAKCSLLKVLMSTAAIVASIATRGYFQPNQRLVVRNEACNPLYCPPLDELRPYEAMVDKKFLQFPSNLANPLPVGLWLAANDDQDRFSGLSPFVLKIDDLRDGGNRLVKYNQVETVDELCDQIRAATKVGTATIAVINGHGSPSGVTLSKNSKLSFSTNLTRCFEPLDPSAPIVLLSCSTGEGSDSFGEILATQSQRRVFAPSRSIPGSGMRVIPGSLTRVEFRDDANEDVTRVFEPSKTLFTEAELLSIEEQHKLNLDFDLKAYFLSESNSLYEFKKLLRTKPLSTGAFEAIFEDAAGKGNTDILDVLLRSGNVVRKSLRARALLKAVEKEHLGAIRKILADGPITDDHREKVLIKAVIIGSNKILKTLLASGPVSEDQRVSLLYYSLLDGHVEVVKTLLAIGPLSEKERNDLMRAAERRGLHNIVQILS